METKKEITIKTKSIRAELTKDMQKPIVLQTGKIIIHSPKRSIQ